VKIATFRRRIADKEYVEFYDCEKVMSEELLEQYKDVERVIAHQVSREKTDFGEKQTEFLVKWCGLPYSECTWEDESLIRMRFSHKIDEYFERVNAETTPKKTHHVCCLCVFGDKFSKNFYLKITYKRFQGVLMRAIDFSHENTPYN
jgi:hypothetical protein